MSAITKSFDLLRGRFQRLRAGRPLEQLALGIRGGISAPTLYRFVRGGSIGQTHALRIERWCDEQELAPAPALAEVADVY